MTPRRVTLLMVAAILVIGLAVWLSSKTEPARGIRPGDVVMAGFDKSALNSVTEVRQSRGDGAHATLQKTSTGWKVGERDYPADTGKVRKLLLDAAALNVVEEKTSNPENYPALGVQDTHSPKATGTLLEAVTPARTYSLIVGKSSGAKSGYVRAAQAAQSLLVTPLLAVDADPRFWLDKNLLDIGQDRIREMTMKPANGPAYSASRADNKQPDFAVTGVPKGRELSSPAAADAIAGSLGGLTLDDVQHPPATAATGVSHITFTTFDGLSIEVAGRKDGNRTLITLTPSSSAKETAAESATLAARLNGWEFEIPSYKYDGLFRPLEDLLKPLPAPAGKGGKKGPPGAGGPQGADGSQGAPMMMPPGTMPPDMQPGLQSPR